jgi:hypothetical protein
MFKARNISSVPPHPSFHSYLQCTVYCSCSSSALYLRFYLHYVPILTTVPLLPSPVFSICSKKLQQLSLLFLLSLPFVSVCSVSPIHSPSFMSAASRYCSSYLSTFVSIFNEQALFLPSLPFRFCLQVRGTVPLSPSTLATVPPPPPPSFLSAVHRYCSS